MAQSKYYEQEKEKQVRLLKHSNLFNGDKGEGEFHNRTYPHILKDGLNNLNETIREDAIQYFNDNNIAWWNGSKPTGNLLSSQIACLNHLMPIRHDEEILLEIINSVQKDIKFSKILPISIDKNPSFIAFEMVSKYDHLNEKNTTRGSNCTSVDAFIYAEDNNGKRWILPIEWKYTENYPMGEKSDKSIEDSEGSSDGKFGKGLERQRRYNSLIDNSKQLKKLDVYQNSIYYFEPFYQLMRQTLWAEQMIENKTIEDIKAEDFLHIHVVPQKNRNLLGKKYPGKKSMEETWRDMINDQSKYILIDPKDFLLPIKEKYKDLWEYLEKRYC